MISQTATLTSKGQITIPAKLLKKTQIKKGQKVIFYLEGNSIRLESAVDMVKRLSGSFPTPPKYRGKNIDDIIRQAKEEHFAHKKI